MNKMKLNSVIEEQFIDLDGINLHVVFAGEKENKPLMLLHGFPDFYYGWKNIILGLRNDFFIIAPDLRGYNLSDKPKGVENYKLEILVEDIKKLRENLNFEKLNLAGHDWGGIIAWAFAEKYPELLEKLIILNSPHYKVFRKKIADSKKQRKASGYIKELIKEGSDELMQKNNFQMLRFSTFQNARKKDAFSDEDRKEYIKSWAQPNALNSAANYYRANRRYDDWTGVIKVPTLVIHGMKDNYIKPIVLNGLEEYVEDLTVLKNPNSSHWIMHDDPEFVNSNIRSFLTK